MIKKPYYCIDCNREINHKGRCLACNVKTQKRMKQCVKCKQYNVKNPKHNLCHDCWNSQENNTYKKEDKEMKYPSHTDLYKNLHLIEEDIVKEIFKKFDFAYTKEGIFGRKETDYSIKIEEKNWDMVVFITKTPDKTLSKKLGLSLFDD